MSIPPADQEHRSSFENSTGLSKRHPISNDKFGSGYAYVPSGEPAETAESGLGESYIDGMPQCVLLVLGKERKPDYLALGSRQQREHAWYVIGDPAGERELSQISHVR
jgi:hypothetical protein